MVTLTLLAAALLATPKLDSSPIEYDFGTVSTMPHTWTWTARNAGDAPLTISAPGCDCRAAGFILPKAAIEPGKSDVITFELNLKSRDYGTGAKSLQLQSTDPDHANFTIVARWNYEPPVICVPADVRFGDLTAGVPSEAYITILSKDPNFSVENVTTTLPTVTFEKTDDSSPSDRAHYPGRQVWRAKINGETPTGLVEAPMVIRASAVTEASPSAAQPQLVEGHVSANIRSRLNIAPRLFRINPTHPGGAIESSITITGPGNETFEITEAKITECDLEGFTVNAEPANSPDPALKNAVRLTIKGTAGETPGLFRGSVRFTTNVPHESPIDIPFNVMVRPAKPAP